MINLAFNEIRIANPLLVRCGLQIRTSLKQIRNGQMINLAFTEIRIANPHQQNCKSAPA
jgi:hypothetical protein